MADDRGNFIWYELMTTDPAAAKAFYDSVIGWNIDTGNSVPDGAMDYRMIKRSDGGFAGGLLAMSQDMIEHGTKPAWIGYVHVPDVDLAVRKVVGSGGIVTVPAMEMDGVGRMAMVADPWGATIYLMTPTPPTEDPEAQSDVFSVTDPQHIRWNELWSTDAQGAVSFYGDLLGWLQEGFLPMGPVGDYMFFQHGATTLGAICGVMPDSPSSHWNYYIGVDDINRAMVAVTAGGGRLLGEAQEIPGGEFSCHARDPQGADFGLVGPRMKD